MATIWAVRERGETTHEQARGKSHLPPVNAVVVSGWRRGGSGKESVGEGHQVRALKIEWERDVENRIASRD